MFCTVDAQFELFAFLSQKRKGVLSNGGTAALLVDCEDGVGFFEFPPLAAVPDAFSPGKADLEIVARASAPPDQLVLDTFEQRVVLFTP
ncbi:hypothetical protein [Nannocystis radixulma]|uniref:Uncharacterized protein n=1 Tax=Nannocystis radixulma TaxID=2995305 RepID=A0ABT5B3W7_9BACT|nr:hypothetical protein [Nannocystis radixulma]MDC0668794.1 hypothetical protein [Nannocystis radixulma]